MIVYTVVILEPNLKFYKTFRTMEEAVLAASKLDKEYKIITRRFLL